MAKWEIFQSQIVMMPLLPGSRMGQGRVQLCRSIRGAQEDKGKDYCKKKMDNGIDLNERRAPTYN